MISIISLQMNRLARPKLFIIINPAYGNGVDVLKQMGGEAGGLVNVARDVDAGEHEHNVGPPLYGS